MSQSAFSLPGSALLLALAVAFAMPDPGLATSGDPCGMLPRPTVQTGDGGSSYILG